MGTAGDDVISSGSGNDTIDGLGGDDITCSGNGNDVVEGGDGADRLDGGNGHDTISGGNGNDEIEGWNGRDVLRGDEGDDDISGWNGSDTIDGGNGVDYVDGGNGNDSCDDAETAPNCEIVTYNGEESGTDAEPIVCEQLTATIVGTDGDDTLVGTSQADLIVGLGGNDTIFGLSGNDTICAGPGDDTIDGGNGSDTIRGGAGDDTIDDWNGADILHGGAGDDVLRGFNNSDTIDGGPGTDLGVGGNGRDTCLNIEKNESCEDGDALLEVSLMLPGDVSGTVQLSGPEQYVVAAEQSDLVSITAAPGTYEVSALPVVVEGVRYVASFNTAQAAAEPGRTGTVVATYAPDGGATAFHVDDARPGSLTLAWDGPTDATYVLRRGFGDEAPATPVDGQPIPVDGFVADGGDGTDSLDGGNGME